MSQSQSGVFDFFGGRSGGLSRGGWGAFWGSFGVCFFDVFWGVLGLRSYLVHRSPWTQEKIHKQKNKEEESEERKDSENTS